MTSRLMSRILFGVLFAILPWTSPAAAQSAAAKAKPAPRTPDGKPDLSGNWEPPRGAIAENIFKDTPGGASLTPAGQAAYKYNQTEVTNPEGLCIFTGTPRNTLGGYPFAIIQNANRVAILYELMTTWRIIPTDAREHPKEFLPSYAGDAIGKWEGDTLVVDIVGIKDHLAWLDGDGHPKSDALHVIEKWRRPDANHLEWDVWAEDPKFYTKPWTFHREFIAMKPGDRPMEFACDENNLDRDGGHLGLGVVKQSSRSGSPKGANK
jgi:hypothetical protein